MLRRAEPERPAEAKRKIPVSAAAEEEIPVRP
jgi:hypothetical protein